MAHAQVRENFWQMKDEMMKNTFYFTPKAQLVFRIFKFLSWLFGHVTKQLDLKDKVNLKFYDVTA